MPGARIPRNCCLPLTHEEEGRLWFYDVTNGVRRSANGRHGFGCWRRCEARGDTRYEPNPN